MGTDTPATDESVPAGRARRWPRLRRLTKSIGAVIAALGIVSAGIGYVTSGAHFFSEIAGYFQGRSELRALIDAGDERLAHADYEAAWRANAKARGLAPRNAAAAAQETRIAMRWLEDMHLSSAAGPQTFSEVVDPLKSALIERLAGTQGREKADLHAHIGWANFLRYRDGHPKTDIAEEFDAAIAADPDNLYGHVMRGFWILWNGGPIEKARGDLDFALRSNTDPVFSDRLIMSALTNITSDDFMAAAIEYADAIRRAGRNIDDHTKRKLLWYYSICLHDANLLATIGKALPAGEQIVVLAWLKEADIPSHETRVASYFMAHFTEKDGKRDEARRLYGELVSTSPDKSEDVTILSRAAVSRLQKP